MRDMLIRAAVVAGVKFAIDPAGNYKAAKRAIEDCGDFANNIVNNTPARDVYIGEAKKRFNRFVEDVKESYDDFL